MTVPRRWRTALLTAAGVATVGAVAAATILISASPAVPPGPPVAWTVDSLARLPADTPPGDTTAAVLSAARGETESFQVAVTGGRRPLAGVDLMVSPLSGPGGAVLGAEAVTRYREHFVTVPPGPAVRGVDGPGGYADALIPFTDPATGAALDGELRARDASVAPDRTQPYWVDVTVPQDAAPGVYRGGWTVSTVVGAASGSVELRVLDLTLPVRPALTGAFLSESGRPAVGAELLRNGVMPGGPVSEMDPALLRSGRLNSVDVGLYSGADRDSCTMAPPPPVEEIVEAARAGPAGAVRYNYTADEIDDCDDAPALYATLRMWAGALHRAGVLQLVTMPPDPALFDDGTGSPVVDVWASLPKDHDPVRAAAAVAQGMQVWSYTALAQDDRSPKWMIGSDPLDLRMMPGFLNQGLGYTGVLYWRVDNWGGGDPWTTAVMYDGRYPGDGMLVYPGERVGSSGGVVPSLRLKWIRDGVDDYGYAELARRAAGDAAVDAVIGPVAPDWQDWSRDPATLTAARSRLAELAMGDR